MANVEEENGDIHKNMDKRMRYCAEPRLTLFKEEPAEQKRPHAAEQEGKIRNLILCVESPVGVPDDADLNDDYVEIPPPRICRIPPIEEARQKDQECKERKIIVAIIDTYKGREKAEPRKIPADRRLIWWTDRTAICAIWIGTRRFTETEPAAEKRVFCLHKLPNRNINCCR